jgi:hypothetical protein
MWIKLKLLLNKNTMERFFDRLGFLGIGLVGLGLVGTRFIFIVDAGERAVVFNKFRGV